MIITIVIIKSIDNKTTKSIYLVMIVTIIMIIKTVDNQINTRVTERTGGSVDFTSMHEYRVSFVLHHTDSFNRRNIERFVSIGSSLLLSSQEYEQLLKDYLAEEQEIANMEADIKEFEYKNGYWLKW